MADNILEFYVQMKDMMSSGLVKLAKNAKETFATATKGNKDFMLSMGALKTKIDDLKFDRMWTNSKSTFDKMGREIKVLERQLSQLDMKGSSSKIDGGIGAGIMGKVAAVASVGAIMAFTGSSVKAAMNYEANGKRFEVLTGNRMEGQDLNARLFNLKKNYGLDATSNASTMLGFGINSQFIEKDIKELAAVSMGNTLRFKELTLAYSQTMAAGKLIGKDYRQFINAGFNPLQTISEHWKEFGYTTKKTIGELQETIHKGGITASMISKAFEIATGHGGRFAGMMDTMADTTQGKLLKLQGQFESFKVGIGQALMPTANLLMDTGNDILKSLGFAHMGSSLMMSDQTELMGLVGSITSLNEGNGLRLDLLQRLQAKYPDFLGNVNIETVSNNELLKKLNDVNDAYDRRIKLMANKEEIDFKQQKYTKLLSESSHMKGQIDAINSGRSNYAFENKSANDFMIYKYRSLFKDVPFIGNGKVEIDAHGFKNYQERYNEVNKLTELAKKDRDDAVDRDKLYQRIELFKQAMQWADPLNLSSLKDHLKTKKQRENFLSVEKGLNFMGGQYQLNGDTNISDSYVSQLRNAMNPNSIVKESANLGTGESGEGTASSIARGGQRIININGVKFIERLEIHSTTVNEAFEELEPKLQDMYLRLLNSGSKMQG